MKRREPRTCGDCGANPGELHDPGCDVERCAVCGGQAIACPCIYVLNDMPYDALEEEHPDIFTEGPTQEMGEVLDAHVEKLGGRLPWTGEFPGCAECREFGLWCRWVDMPANHICLPSRGKCNVEHGWVVCDQHHPDATENLNRLHEVAEWDVSVRRFVLRKKD